MVDGPMFPFVSLRCVADLRYDKVERGTLVGGGYHGWAVCGAGTDFQAQHEDHASQACQSS